MTVPGRANSSGEAAAAEGVLVLSMMMFVGRGRGDRDGNRALGPVHVAEFLAECRESTVDIALRHVLPASHSGGDGGAQWSVGGGRAGVSGSAAADISRLA